MFMQNLYSIKFTATLKKINVCQSIWCQKCDQRIIFYAWFLLFRQRQSFFCNFAVPHPGSYMLHSTSVTWVCFRHIFTLSHTWLPIPCNSRWSPARHVHHSPLDMSGPSQHHVIWAHLLPAIYCDVRQLSWWLTSDFSHKVAKQGGK